ncbi:atrial natriuretic peptide receptor 1-like [Watersipora subatra]|uniref:atrial natriuretic peptide receptor 1-like n=1 Tax=Watersipora subatra TaxID=2589382 RepID=UPI00355AEAA2
MPPNSGVDFIAFIYRAHKGRENAIFLSRYSASFVYAAVISRVFVQASYAWHDLSNVQFHCWPFGANDDNPTSFAVCTGVDLDWVITPPHEVIENEPFEASFSLILSSEFYAWAVQDAQDNFKSNFFKRLDGSFIASNGTVAQEWCEQQQCPEECAEATQDNCCLHHVNVHSCPVDEVKFGLCPPWIPADGNFYTHSAVNCGSALITNWTAKFSGLHLKDNKITSTALIAHFKVATVHLALNWMITVTPRSVCRDGTCNDEDGEDCSTCPSDCGKCPLTVGELSAIIAVAIIVASIILIGVAYLKYTNNKLLWDESWIVNYTDIKYTEEPPGAVGNSLHNMTEPIKTPVHVANIIDKGGHKNIGMYNGELHYLKRVNKKGFKLTKQIRTEVRQIRRFDHTNVTQFVGACVKVPNIFILSKFCSKGNLAKVLTAKNIPLSWAFRFSFATDIISGLSYLHSHEVCHGRLHLQNCLVDDRWSVKISDFGVPSLRSTESTSVSQQSYQRFKIWKAPELKHGCMSLEGDMFSYGILMMQISTRTVLPKKNTANLEELKMDWKNALVRNELSCDEKCPCPSPVGVAVESCLEMRASLRPSATLMKRQMKTINPNKMNAVDLMMLMMEKYSKHLELMVAEKTQDLQAEKKRTDELLHTMLPKQVADDLRMGRPVNADEFESCTVFFSDIVGFTTISGAMSPMDVVVFLNKLYSCFDTVIDKHDVYKVETIGDAYMVVSGVPIRNGNKHVTNIADMALDLLEQSKSFVIPNMPNELLRIRIGLHSGPVCAGVVGLKMPRYCLFGDTVNTASRMESTGEAYKIHMSNDTKEYLVRESLPQEYKIVERGTIAVKGKGDLKTWWLEGKVTPTQTIHPSTRMLGMEPENISPFSVGG